MHPSRKLLRPYLALAVVCIVWGTTYVGLTVALRALPPLWLAGIRLTIPGVLMTGWSLFRGDRIRSRRSMRTILIASLLIQFSANVFITWSLQFISSGLIALLCTLIPFFVVLLQLLVFRSERFNHWILAGLFIALLGMILLYADNVAQIASPNYLIGVCLVLFSNLTWAWGSILSGNKSDDTNAFFSAGLQLLVSGLLILGLALVWETVNWSAVGGDVWWAVVYLIVFDSIIAFSCYLYALKTLPTTLVSVFAYVNPVVALWLGWFLLSEPLTLKTGLAGILVLAGVYAVNTGYKNT